MCLNAGAMGRIDAESETLIPTGGFFDGPVHALRADGFDASEDGTGRGTPPVAVFDPNQVTSKGNRSQPTPELSHTLPAKTNSPIAFAIGSHAGCADGDQTNRSHANGGPVGSNISEELAYSVRASRPQSVAFGFANTAGDTDLGIREEQAAPITTRNGDPGLVLSVALRGRDGGGTAELGGEVATALRASQGGGEKPHALNRFGVRRLMPVETERLQGFPDGHTAIAYRGKPAADGPRYKAVGNSMAVPVVRWILTRIEWLDRNVPEVA